MRSTKALPERTDDGAGPFAMSRGLGLFSLALGAAEVAAPRILATSIGIEADRRSKSVLRAMGAREIAAGLAVLLLPQRPAPLWSRVVGDVIDLALLAIAAKAKRTSGLRLAGAAAAVAGVTALDVIASRRAQRAYAAANRPVLGAVTINRPPQDVYDFYRRLEMFPLFMDWIERIDDLGNGRSHWVARMPLGVATVEWDAEIVEDRPGEVIAWRSVDSRIKTSGRVMFARAPGRDATEVRVEMQLGFTGLPPTTGIAKFFAKSQLRGDLQRLKQVLETGEVVRSDASIHAGPHPAKPSIEGGVR